LNGLVNKLALNAELIKLIKLYLIAKMDKELSIIFL